MVRVIVRVVVRIVVRVVGRVSVLGIDARVSVSVLGIDVRGNLSRSLLTSIFNVHSTTNRH